MTQNVRMIMVVFKLKLLVLLVPVFQRLSVLCRPAEAPAWRRRKMGEEGATVELTTFAVTS